MQNERVSSYHIKCIIALFTIGTNLVVGINKLAGQDAWMSFLIGLCMAIPIILIYSRIIQIYPDKDIFEMMSGLFGKSISKVLITLLSVYALVLASVVLRNITEFIAVTAFPETPQLPLLISITLTVIYLVKSGANVMGKWAMLALTLVVISFGLTLVASLKFVDFKQLLPVGEHSLKTIFTGAMESFAFPFAETVLILAFAGTVDKKISPYKVYLPAVLFSAVVLLLGQLRNITVLGVPMTEKYYFPSLAATRIMSISNVLERSEVTVSINILLAGLIKLGVCLYAAAKGVAKLCNIEHYKTAVIPMAVMTLAICPFLFNNAMEMASFRLIYKYLAFPFQVIIPILVWIVAEVKNKKQKKKAVPTSQENDDVVFKATSKVNT